MFVEIYIYIFIHTHIYRGASTFNMGHGRQAEMVSSQVGKSFFWLTSYYKVGPGSRYTWGDVLYNPF